MRSTPKCDVCGAPAMFDYRQIGKVRCSEHYIPKAELERRIFEVLDGLADQEDHMREVYRGQR